MAVLQSSAVSEPEEDTATAPGRLWLVTAVGAVTGLLLFFVARQSLPDDSYITFGYARNLADHGEWALVPGIGSNTATSPLNVWALAALTLVTGSPVISAALLLAGSLALTTRWLHVVARGARLPATAVSLVGVALLAASPLLASTVGLETYLAAALFVGLVRTALFGSWPPAGVVTGLLVLARPDMVTVAVAVLMVAAVYRLRWRGPLVALVLGGAIALPWSLYLWFRFGSATSDTLPAKSVAGGWGGYTLVDGLGHYLDRWTLATSLALLPVVLGVALCLVLAVVLVSARGRRGELGAAAAVTAAFAVGGLLDWTVMSVMGVVPFFWYYAPLFTGLSLAGLTAAAALVRVNVRVGTAAVLAVAATAGLLAAYDVGRGVPWDGMAPIRINWATPAQYARIGAELPHGAVVESPGEIGTIAYFCDCTVVDYLADPGRMVPYIERYRAEHPGSALLALNYRHYDPPAPVPARWKIVYEPVPPASPTDWPTNFPVDGTKRMRLVPAS